MNILLRQSQVIDTLNERIGKFSSWLILVAVVICSGNAVIRYAFNMSSNAWLEIQWYLNSAMFLLVAAYALKLNAHVRIDAIAGKLSARAQAWIDLLGGVFMLLPAVLIPVAFGLLALQGLSEIVKRVAFLKGLIPNPAEDRRGAPIPGSAEAGYLFFAAPAKSDLRIIAFTPFTRSTTCVTWKSVPALR